MARAAPLNRRSAALAVAAVLVLLSPLPGCVQTAGGPLTVWVVDESRAITPDDSPLLENEVYFAGRGQIRLVSAINETVAFQIALRTTRPPAGPFDVRLSDLTGPAGRLDARSTFTLHRAAATRIERFRSWYPQHTQRRTEPLQVLDILVPWDAPRGGGPVRLDTGQTEMIWVDVRVPPRTAPGGYAGRIEIVPAGQAGGAVFSAAIQLDVLPVAIPSERYALAICRVDPRDLLESCLRWPRVEAEETRLLPDSPSHLAAVRLTHETMELLHQHRTTPILWASFPKVRPAGERAVDVEWEPYDALVSGWVDGSAFDDGVALAVWPLPVSLRHPDADLNAGFESPRYARMLGAYLEKCRAHFAQRGWEKRAVVRILPPGPLDDSGVARVRRLAGILRQSRIDVPLVAHLPPESLRPLGWHAAPAIDIPDVRVWAPPADWFEPLAMVKQRTLGRRTWFIPAAPQFSPSLAPESLPRDPTLLAWQAFRYGAGAIWIEHATEFTARPDARADTVSPALEALVYSGAAFSVFDRPLASVRLKRLRRGLQDAELLRLLVRNGRQLLAARTSEQVFRRGFTDACGDSLLSTRPGGWTDDPHALWLARTLVRQELANVFEPTATGQQAQARNLADWERLLVQAAGVRAEIEGVRLTADSDALRARVFVTVANDTRRPLEGQWRLDAPPVNWQVAGSARISVPPAALRTSRIELMLGGLGYSSDGLYSFDLSLDAGQGGTLPAVARLAATAAPYIDEPIRVDGRLGDWPRGASNSAGDFRLVRGGEDQTASGGAAGPPALSTRAFFCHDTSHVYVAVQCGLPPNEAPHWQPDNEIPMDGAIPWGQDVVEVLISPDNLVEGTPADLYLLQIKASGLLEARRGCPTDPPLGPSEPWPSGARVAVGRERDAWTVELSLPLASLGDRVLRQRIWGVNVTRLDARRGQYSSWSGARSHCYSPQRLGNLFIVRP